MRARRPALGKETWLRCPACQYEWRAYVIFDEDDYLPLDAEAEAKLGCNRCPTDQPMQVVDGPERRKRESIG